MLDYAATLGTQRAGQRSWIVRLLRAILRPVAGRDPRVLLFGLWLFLFAALSVFPRPFFLGRPPFLVPLLLRRSLRLGTLHSFRLGSFRPYPFRPHSFLRDGLRLGWARRSLLSLLRRRSLRLGTLHSFRLGSLRPYAFRPHSFLRDGLRLRWALNPLRLLLAKWLAPGFPPGGGSLGQEREGPPAAGAGGWC